MKSDVRFYLVCGCVAGAIILVLVILFATW
jgi:hypothetical protein